MNVEDSTNESVIINVLVVDDNINNVKLVNGYLKHHNTELPVHFEAVLFTDPELAYNEFLKRLQSDEHPFQVAILDWNMPKITGEILSLMLKNEDSKIKTILYTARNDDKLFLEMAKDCYRMDECFFKLGDPNQNLGELIIKLLTN